MSGLYLSIKDFLRHRSGPLNDATLKVMKCQYSLDKIDDKDGHDPNGTRPRTVVLHELEEANKALRKSQRMHFKNSLALLKVGNIVQYSNLLLSQKSEDSSL